MNKLILAAMLTLAGITAQAQIITIDPDDYPHASDISAVQPGATLRTLSQSGGGTYSPTISSVYDHDCLVGTPAGTCGAFEGHRDFGSLISGTVNSNWSLLDNWDLCSRIASWISCMSGYRVLEIQFSKPVSIAQIETSWLSDEPALIAFNSAGTELFRCSTNYWPCSYDSTWNYSGYHETRFFMSRATADISRIVVGSIGGSARLGEISYLLPSRRLP